MNVLAIIIVVTNKQADNKQSQETKTKEHTNVMVLHLSQVTHFYLRLVALSSAMQILFKVGGTIKNNKVDK